MKIFIDDSGDPGFKFDKTSSRYFTIAAVYCDEPEDYTTIERALEKLKQELGFKKQTEFKFRKAREDVRTRFFQTVKSLDFKIVIAIIDKYEMSDRKIIKNPSLFYNTVILKVLQYIQGEGRDLKVIIDGKPGRNYRRSAKTFLRQNLPKGCLKSLDYHDSKNDTLIQLADMVAGAKHFSKEDVPGASKYIRQVAQKVQTVITAI